MKVPVTLTEAVSAAIESGCTDESLAPIADVEPASVRAAISQVVQTWQRDADPGLHTRVAGRWRRHRSPTPCGSRIRCPWGSCRCS